MGFYDDIKKFWTSREGTAFATFLTTRNAADIGKWLQALGKAMAAGKGTAVASLAVKAGVEVAGLGLAAYIAYKEVKRQWDESKKIWNKDDINGFQKIARIALEAHPVTMTIRSIDAGWKWLTKSKKQIEEESNSKSTSNKSMSPVRTLSSDLTSSSTKFKGTVTPEESGKQVVEHERSKAKPTTTIKTTSDRLAEFMKNKRQGNHPDWYAKYPEFVTTNLNFGVRKEAQYFKVALGALISAAQVIPQREKSTSQAYIDQLNVLFAKLRGSNSGAFNYTVEDLMNYIECVRSIRILMHQISKYIKSINNIDLYIAKTPDATMQVLGMDTAAISDLRQNRALYIARFNEYAEAIDANFPTPPDMTVFDRDEYLSTVILEEGKGPKSSIYSYKFTQLIRAYTNPGEVEYQGFATTYGVNDYFTALDSFINRAHAYVSATYSNFDTFAKIAGDIFKAYGNLGLKRRFNKLSLSDKNTVIYDEYLLHQLQNAQTLTLLGNTYLGVTGATPTTIKYTAQIRVQGNNTSNYIPKERVIGNIRGTEAPLVINTNKSEISGAEAISLTRGNWYFDLNVNMLYGNTGQVVEVDTCDTVALIQCTAFYFDVNNTISSTLFRSFAHDIGFPQHYSVWSQLDYAPAFYLYDESNNNGDRYIIEDIDTYAYMTVDQYRAFTDTAVISMYKTVDISDQVNFRAVKR